MLQDSVQNFEKGAFTDAGERTAKETLNIIRQFSWEQQLEHIVTGLTNPSVTIAGRDKDFLKLSLYYNDKFVLHYCNADDELWTKAFVRLADSFPLMTSFFEERPENYHHFFNAPVPDKNQFGIL